MNLEELWNERDNEIIDQITHYLEWRIPESRSQGEDKRCILLGVDGDYTLKDLINFLKDLGYSEIKEVDEDNISLDITVKGK